MSLDAKNICYGYPKTKKHLVEDFSIEIKPGEVVGLLGPSGWGKSTIGKILAGQITPEKGSVKIDGNPLPKNCWCPVQLNYQHPELAVNPTWKMGRVLEEVGEIDDELRKELGIKDIFLDRWPQELSGGELQRFNIYRALRNESRYILADEISTMLDVITQAQLWNVILEHAKKRNIGLLAITHNHNLSKAVCTRTVEVGN